ncbi:MAG TPA: DMT family transporter [Pseudolabrys sp.]|jgi:drug/metabolite transporter (DMT)-like permease|uniref:DMT family transporter n=1 Tax=Pseudolabrys sp. TaxID=1960880 RepID=UPI002DDCB3B0|nr:DMT family transporter [Pseudolabrys sp.]HEV2628451.1 DMT family transporter [Pseudolabrys sp.]
MAVSRERWGITLGIAGVVLFGGTLPATRVAVGYFDPLFLTAVRASVAGCAGLTLLVLLRRPIPPPNLWFELVVTGICTIIGFPVFMALAMAHVPAAHGGVVLGIVPLATVAAAALVAGERPSLGFWLASATGAAVVMAFVLRDHDGVGFALGDLFLLGTVVSGAFGYALSGRLSMQMPGWEVISWQVAGFLPFSLVAALTMWHWQTLDHIAASAWAGLAYVSLVSQFLAFFVFNAAMALAGVARAGQLMLLQPFVIVALAWPVNGEPIRLDTLVYACAVFLVVFVGQRMRVRRR